MGNAKLPEGDRGTPSRQELPIITAPLSVASRRLWRSELPNLMNGSKGQLPSWVPYVSGLCVTAAGWLRRPQFYGAV